MPSALLPPPSLGWNTRDALTAMRPGFAPVLDNFVVERGGAAARRGWRVWATGLPGRVGGLLPYTAAGAAFRLFAASGGGIYEVTSGGAVGPAAVSGLTGAGADGAVFAALGGTFLLAFNGADPPQVFDGAAWAPWGGTGVPAPVAWARGFKGRLYVGHPSRLSFFYGGPGAIGGPFAEFPLQGVASGGGVCAMVSLSGDGGDGPDDLALFVTTEGEVLVYAGTDPSSAATWGLVGRWRVARPVGAPHRCALPLGGDALLMTEAGVLPLSALRAGADASEAFARAALTRHIAPTWRDLVRERGASSPGWGLAALPALGLTVVNAPWGPSDAQQVVASLGDALSRFTGVPAACWAEGAGRAWFGDATAQGRVMLYGEDAGDDGLGVRCEAVGAFSAFGAPGRVKAFKLVAPVLRGAAGIAAECRLLGDWLVPGARADLSGPGVAPPPLPPLALGGDFGVWDAAAWDAGLWAGEDGGPVSRGWRAAPLAAHAAAPWLRLTAGRGRPVWLGSNVAWETGGAVR